MANQQFVAILFRLISSIIACIQLHVTMLNVHGEYNKYETTREYKALKGVIQSKENFFLLLALNLHS